MRVLAEMARLFEALTMGASSIDYIELVLASSQDAILILNHVNSEIQFSPSQKPRIYSQLEAPSNEKASSDEPTLSGRGPGSQHHQA